MSTTTLSLVKGASRRAGYFPALICWQCVLVPRNLPATRWRSFRHTFLTFLPYLHLPFLTSQYLPFLRFLTFHSIQYLTFLTFHSSQYFTFLTFHSSQYLPLLHSFHSFYFSIPSAPPHSFVASIAKLILFFLEKNVSESLSTCFSSYDWSFRGVLP